MPMPKAETDELTKSRYVHTVPTADGAYLYDSLNMTILELSAEECRELDEFLLAAPGDRIHAPGRLEEELREYGMILPARSNEPGQALERLRALRRGAARSRDARIGFARISLTERCNMACSYCFQQDLFEQYQPTMSRSVLEATVNGLIAQSRGRGLAVQYFGDEPHHRYALIRHAHSLVPQAAAIGALSRVYETLTTNGTLLTAEMAKFFVESGFAIVFSLDGWRSANDEHRIFKNGRGTFDTVIEAIARYREAGGPVSILLTTTKESLARLPDVVEYLISDPDIRASEIGLNAPQPRPGGWDVGGGELARTVQQCWMSCAEAGVRFYGPGTFIPELLKSRQPQFDRCIEGDLSAPSGDWPLYVAADGTSSYCVVHHQDERCTDPSVVDVKMSRLRRWHYDDSSVPVCDTCIASMVCGGPCSLELMLWEGNLNEDRCGFLQDMTRWALAH